MRCEIDGISYDLDDLLREGFQWPLGNKGWRKLEDYSRGSSVDRSFIEGWEYFLETLQLSKVDILKYANAENGKPGYYPIEQPQDQKKLLLTPGIEFKFSGGALAPFMKIEVERDQSLLLKYFRNMETDRERKGCNGGLLLLLPEFTISTGNDWLRHIVISTENNNLTLVFGDNPTRKEGGNYFAVSYKREIKREVMRVPYSNLNP
jgi:hypothetical protein